MRKQTKVVAVASAAALLAIGASMTSFAATGWVEEDGTWYFYDSDGNRVEDAWKKSGENWYWLDGEEGGAMAIEKIVEDDDDTYYVDANGVMVRNTWVKVVNEDQDEDEDPAEYHYYYMQSNGKAYKAPDNGNTRFRTIDGKRYAFDSDGVMLYGWVNESSERATDEDDWATEGYKYYLGNWDDGAMKTSWQKISVHDANEDDDMEYYFNFKSNGKKRYNDAPTEKAVKEEKINGQRYGFDERGVMTYQWTLATDPNSGKSATAASTSNWRYFNSPEDGARVTKDWFRVVAPADDNDNTFRSNYGVSFADEDAGDENERWYYSDGDGKVVSGEIRKIKGKYYAFRPEDEGGTGKAGAMLSGLVLMKVDATDGTILEVIDDGVDSDELDALMDDDINTTIVKDYEAALEDLEDGQYISLYYFGDEVTDGAMKTGATTVTLDGETYHFMFSKTGGVEGKGRGLTGVDDNKYIYKLGCRIEADSDDKYQVVAVRSKKGSTDIQAPNVNVTKIKSIDLKNAAAGKEVGDYHEYDRDLRFVNTDKETVTALDVSQYHYYLVNTSGNIQKSKVAAKDGDDWYFYVKNREVKLYSNNKNLNIYGTDKAEKWEDIVVDVDSSN
jgi:glucan-binding YG repeat protein